MPINMSVVHPSRVAISKSRSDAAKTLSKWPRGGVVHTCPAAAHASLVESSGAATQWGMHPQAYP
mgnify:CR=1 FL=1